MTKQNKNPAAVALGRKGGSVTGVAKGFATMTLEQRQEIGRKFGRPKLPRCPCGSRTLTAAAKSGHLCG